MVIVTVLTVRVITAKVATVLNVLLMVIVTVLTVRVITVKAVTVLNVLPMVIPVVTVLIVRVITAKVVIVLIARVLTRMVAAGQVGMVTKIVIAGQFAVRVITTPMPSIVRKNKLNIKNNLPIRTNRFV